MLMKLNEFYEYNIICIVQVNFDYYIHFKIFAAKQND